MAVKDHPELNANCRMRLHERFTPTARIDPPSPTGEYVAPAVIECLYEK
jgi:hypothetical protein